MYGVNEMNVCLIQLIVKIFNLLIVTLMSLFHVTVFQTNTIDVASNSQSKNVSVVNQVVPYETITQYNRTLPSTVKNVLQEGQSGVTYTNETGITTVLETMQPEIIEVGTGPSGAYTGRVTGYGPDCKGCSKAGNVSCRTREGTKHSLYQGATYTDKSYGSVQILAGARSLFPCGTIIELNNGKTNIVGIVLDSGGSMETAWKNNQSVWIDIAYPSQLEARTNGIMTGKNIKMQVKRWGW